MHPLRAVDQVKGRQAREFMPNENIPFGNAASPRFLVPNYY